MARPSGPAPPLAQGPPVFVVGPPRSGTHLLRFCLSRHSRLHVGPETGFFLKLDGDRRLLAPGSFPRRAEEIVDRLLRSGDPTMEDVLPLREELVARVRAGPADHRALAEVLLGTIAGARGKARWGEKTPFHVLYVDRILALFPEARIVCLRREARNVVASYLKSPLLPDDLATALAQTRLCVRAGAKAVAAGRAHEVRYEELVADPEPVLRGVADYVGERFEEGMLRPGMRDSSFGDGELMQREEGLGIVHDPDEAHKWRRTLSDEEGEIVRRMVEGAPGPVPLGLRLRVARAEAIQRVMHGRNRLGLHSLKVPGGRPG